MDLQTNILTFLYIFSCRNKQAVVVVCREYSRTVLTYTTHGTHANPVSVIIIIITDIKGKFVPVQITITTTTQK